MPIRKRPTTDQLYWRFQFQGKSYEKSMETSNKREATERGTRWEIEVKDAYKDASNDAQYAMLHPTLAVLRDKDVARMRDERRNINYILNSVVANYKHLIKFFPDTRAVTDQSLEDYVKHRRAEKTRRQTIARELLVLKRGFRLMRIKGPEFWPTLSRDEPNEKLASKRHSKESWAKWLGALSDTSTLTVEAYAHARVKAYAMALFSLCTGLRREELYRVRPTDIVSDEGYRVLTVKEKVKRKHKRRVVLGPIATYIEQYLPFVSDHKNSFKTACRGNPTGNITLRDCRAAFATAGDRCGDSRATDLAMGHSGVPARYQKADYERLHAVAMAAEAWVFSLSWGPAPGGS